MNPVSKNMNKPFITLAELKLFATTLLKLKDARHLEDCTCKDILSSEIRCGCLDLKSSLVMFFNHISSPAKAPESKLMPTAEKKIRALLDHGYTVFSGLAVADHVPIYLRSALGSMLVTQIRVYGMITSDSCSEISVESLPTEPSSSPPFEGPSTSAATGDHLEPENPIGRSLKRQRCYGPTPLTELINLTSSPDPAPESSSGLTDIKGKKPSS